MYFVFYQYVFVKGEGRGCGHYIRMGRDVPTKGFYFHSLSGTGAGGFKYTLMSVWKGGGKLP